MTPDKKYQNLKTKLGHVTTKYGGKTKYEKFHAGIDIANAEGTPIPAFTNGKVEGIKPNAENDQSYGNSILIKDKFGNTHRYSHLKDILVKPGQDVKKDEKIGTMGQTGSAYSPGGGDASHLDFRIVKMYKDHQGRVQEKNIDPTKYVKKYV